MKSPSRSWLRAFLYLLAISSTYECLFEENAFKYGGANVYIDVQYNSLLTTISNINSQDECAIYVALRRQFQWFVYNKVEKTCVTSKCWAVPVQQSQSSDNVYYKQEGKAIQSCSDVKDADSSDTDGEYWIFPDAPTFLGCPTRIFCNDMGTASPKEFISLSVTNTGTYPQLANPWCTGETTTMPAVAVGKPGTTNFFKIRVNIQTMAVHLTDFTFTSSTGQTLHYGQASDCYSDRYCGRKGTFHINTIGTGIIIDKKLTWTAYGNNPHTPYVTRSADGVRIDIQGGGWPGGSYPDQPMLLHKNHNEGKAIQSCSDVKDADSSDTDGEYWIFPDAPTFLGCPTRIFCNDMGTASPKEFISLSVTNTGTYPQLANPWCTGETTTMPAVAVGKPGTTNFFKIRVNIQTMAVHLTDFTFTSSTGQTLHYGQASDCYSDRYCGRKGTFHINTIGTGIIIDKKLTWTAYGNNPHTPYVTRSADGVRIDIQGGGWPGGSYPDQPMLLHKNHNEDLAPGSAVLVKEKTCCS